MMLAAALLIIAFLTPTWAEEGPEVWLEQARMLYRARDYDGALALLEEIPKRFPEDRTAQLRAAVLAARIHFRQGRYDEVLGLLKPFVQKAELPDEALYLLAAACEKKGLLSEALTYIRLLKLKYPRSPFLCQADLVAARIFKRRKLEEKARRFARRALGKTCRLEDRAEAVALLLELGVSPEELKPYLGDEVLRHAPEIVKVLAKYYIARGDLKRAEENIYKYLNFSGREKEAPELLFELGEAYYQRGEYREARRLFELINTSWPYTREGALAKFRLLYMRYLFEKKVAAPRVQTMKLLVASARGLKREWPDSPLTEEAHALEVALLLDLKKVAESLESGWDFLERYPRSPYRARVLRVLCRASALWLQGLLGRKDYEGAVLFFKEHEAALSEGRCGLVFYRAAEAYRALDLYGEALTVMLKAYGYRFPENWAPDYLLTLADLLLFHGEPGDLALAREIVARVERDYPLARKSPYLAFLSGVVRRREGKKAEALGLLRRAEDQAGDPELAARARRELLALLVEIGRYEEALSLLRAEREGDRGLLKEIARRTIEEGRWSLARRALDRLGKELPDDPEVKWLKGLYYERRGEGEKALAVWKSLAGAGFPYGELARDLVEAARLLEEAKSELY